MATGTRILVVEDESAIRELIRDSLALIEIETDGACDPTPAPMNPIAERTNTPIVKRFRRLVLVQFAK